MSRLSLDTVYRDGLHHVYLLPGEVHCATEPTVITTVLGSCVAVCLWDKFQRIGGMNHFVLPHGSDSETSLRYGNCAIDELKSLMLAAGSRIDHLVAKVFGGATVLSFNAAGDTIGDKNTDLALNYLSDAGIPVIARATGGLRGYEARFYTATGEVVVRRLADADDAGAPSTDCRPAAILRRP